MFLAQIRQSMKNQAMALYRPQTVLLQLPPHQFPADECSHFDRPRLLQRSQQCFLGCAIGVRRVAGPKRKAESRHQRCITIRAGGHEGNRASPPQNSIQSRKYKEDYSGGSIISPQNPLLTRAASGWATILQPFRTTPQRVIAFGFAFRSSARAFDEAAHSVPKLRHTGVGIEKTPC